MNETLNQFNLDTEKIRRRIADVHALANDKVLYNDQRVKNVESNVSSTIKQVYGETSPEYRDFRSFTILTGGMRRQPILQRSQFNNERQRQFASCIPNAASRLDNLINVRQEQIADGTVCPSCDSFYRNAKHAFCLDCGSRITSPSYDGDAETLKLPSGE